MACLEKDGLLTEEGIEYWEAETLKRLALETRCVFIQICDLRLILQTLRAFQEKAWMYDELCH